MLAGTSVYMRPPASIDGYWRVPAGISEYWWVLDNTNGGELVGTGRYWRIQAGTGGGLVAPCISLIIFRSAAGHELQQVKVLKRGND